jgi:hypothetical protein
MIRLYLLKVDIGTKVVWVGIRYFNGRPDVFVSFSEESLLKFRLLDGAPKELPTCSTIMLHEFEEYIPTHPILSLVTDWRKMGLPIDLNRST